MLNEIDPASSTPEMPQPALPESFFEGGNGEESGQGAVQGFNLINLRPEEALEAQQAIDQLISEAAKEPQKAVEGPASDNEGSIEVLQRREAPTPLPKQTVKEKEQARDELKGGLKKDLVALRGFLRASLPKGLQGPQARSIPAVARPIRIS